MSAEERSAPGSRRNPSRGSSEAAAGEGGKRTGPAAVVLVVLAALALRLPGHLDSGLWFDEIWSLTVAGRAPLASVVSSYPNDNHHPLYNLFGWGAVRLFGESAWAWRLPAVVFGALSVGLLLVYARRVTAGREAWLATALLATSYHHVWFSQNARAYTMLLFFTLAATLLWEELDAGRAGRGRLAGYALASALAVYSHPTAVVLAGGHLAASAVSRRSRRGASPPGSWRPVLGGVALAAGIALLLYAPMLREMAGYYWLKTTGGAAADEIAALASSAWSSPWWTVTATARSLGLGLAAGLTALAVGAAVVVAGAVAYAREAPGRVVAWSAPGLLLGLLLVVLGRNLWPRFFFLLAGFALLVLARGWLRIVRAVLPPGFDRARAERVAAVGLWLAWSTLLPRAWALPKQDFEGARDELARIRRAGDEVATVGLAILPYRDYYETDYVAVESVAELAALERRAQGVVVVSTLDEYVRSRRPALAAELAARGREVARLRGSVSDGDVVVLRLSPAAAGDAAP